MIWKVGKAAMDICGQPTFIFDVSLIFGTRFLEKAVFESIAVLDAPPKSSRILDYTVRCGGA